MNISELDLLNAQRDAWDVEIYNIDNAKDLITSSTKLMNRSCDELDVKMVFYYAKLIWKANKYLSIFDK